MNQEHPIDKKKDKTFYVDPSSYVDPNGFVFWDDGNIYRAIHDDVCDFFKDIITSGYAQELIDHYHLVPTRISKYSNPQIHNKLILEHEYIQPITYCVEWCPSMLKEAALSLLSLSIHLAEKNLILQDAYPWNIVFDATAPVYVDFTSINKADPRWIWPAHGQFISFFLYPLLLSQMGKFRIARALLMDNINGIGLNEFILNASLSYKVRHPQLLFTSMIDHLIQRNKKIKMRLNEVISKQMVAIDKNVRIKFYSKLHKKIDRLTFGNRNDVWREYYQNIPNNVDKKVKIKTIKNLLTRLTPKTVLDLGANTGVFSIIAAESGAKVLAVDSSTACMESLFYTAKSQSLNITPLVVDVLNPTPSFGYLSKQYPAFINRVKSELTMCLGLMHHLHIAGRQSFDRISELMKTVTERYLIFEYVDRLDENIELINTTRDIDYDIEVVISALESGFKIIDALESDRESRKLIICEKK